MNTDTQHFYIGASTEDMLCVLRFLSRFTVSRLKYRTFQSQFQSGTLVKNFQLGKKRRQKEKEKRRQGKEDSCQQKAQSPLLFQLF